MARRDNRDVAAEWIRDNVPVGSTLCMTSSYGRVRLPVHDSILEELHRGALDGTPDDRFARIVEARLQMREEGGHRGYFETSYNPERDSSAHDWAFWRRRRTTSVVSESPLGPFDSLPERLAEMITNDYELVRSFVAHDENIPLGRYDRSDAFFFPYSSFEGVDRPGPNIHVYELEQ